jgi:putative pneumococcal histidine triad protein D (fragment)
MRTLVTRLINAKNALHYALEHNTSTQPEFGDNYNKLNVKDEDGVTLRSSADQFAKEAYDPSFPLEFSNADYNKADFEKYAGKKDETNNSSSNNDSDKKENDSTNTNKNDNKVTNNNENSEKVESTINEENNTAKENDANSIPKEESTTETKEVQLTPEETAKLNLLSGIFRLSPDSMNVIDTPYGKAVNFTLGGKNETILIKDIDKLLAALVSSAKPKETSETNNENSTTLNTENEVSNSENNTTSNDNKHNANEEKTTVVTSETTTGKK